MILLCTSFAITKCPLNAVLQAMPPQLRQAEGQFPGSLQANSTRQHKASQSILYQIWCLQIDEQDAEERAELRRRQIEAANKMLYDDTDRPKKLHSKMLLSDVMQERVAQMDYAKQIKALKRHQHEAFLVQQAARLKVHVFSWLKDVALLLPLHHELVALQHQCVFAFKSHLSSPTSMLLQRGEDCASRVSFTSIICTPALWAACHIVTCSCCFFYHCCHVSISVVVSGTINVAIKRMALHSCCNSDLLID